MSSPAVGASAATESAADGAPSLDRLTATIAALAGDEFTGRRVGTTGGRAARVWLASRLSTLDAVVSTDEFPVTGVRELTRTPFVEWSDGVTRRTLVHRRDFVEHLASAELPLPYPGALIAADAPRLRGGWVVADAASVELVDRAVAEGAVGLLVPRGTDGDGWMPKMIVGPGPGPLPVIGVRTDLHAEMIRAAGRGEVAASMPLRTVAVTGVNVYGTFADPVPGGLSVLLTAHYDGVGDDPGQRLPAAVDNASGVAVVIEAARLLVPWLPAGVGLAVALLDGEEAGARGSAHHAPTVAPGTQVINVDGAGLLDGAASVEAGGPAHALLAALDQAGRATGVALRAGSMASDNRRYAAAGLAAVGIGMGIPGYQTPAETVDRIDPDTLLAATRLVVATVEHLIRTTVNSEAGGSTR